MAESWLRRLVGAFKRRDGDPSRGEISLREFAGSLLLGAFAGVAITALCGGGDFEAFAVYGAHIAVLWALSRAWVGRSARRPGRLRRTLLIVVAGVVLAVAEFALAWLAFGPTETIAGPIDPADELLTLSVVASILALAPALLLALRAEREGLRAGWFWWIPRALGAGVFGALLLSVGIALEFEFGRFWRVDWDDPTKFLWYAEEEPLVVLVLLGPTVLLAMLVGADSRWRDAAGPGAPGAAARPSPTAPRAEDGPLSTPRLEANPWPGLIAPREERA